MIQSYRIFRHTPPRGPGLLVCVILTGQPVGATDLGYPPPPGAYRSEPAAQMEPTRPPPPAISAGAESRGPESARSSSRLLPLPDDMFGAKRSRYDADNLFGTSQPVREGQPDVSERADARPAAPTRLNQFAPVPRPAETMPGYAEFAMDSGPGKQPTPAAQAYPERGQPADPTDAPGYQAYQQRYESPYYPGAATGSRPTIGAPGHVDQYAPGYRQTGGGTPSRSHHSVAAPHSAGYDNAHQDALDGGAIPEGLTGAPISVPTPDPADSSVFRPPHQ